MTRKNAREIALGCIFECFSRREAPEEILDKRITADGVADLSEEAPGYRNERTPKDEAYIRETVVAATMNAGKYFSAVDALSEAWSSARIARMTRAILCLAMAEIEFLQDVPPSVAVNEAVELAKQYDTEKAPAYINGILGRYLRSRAAETETAT